ncbi:C4-dicarboxylate TRAP transporter large permease protein DctM [subsurface metagenome]
MLILLFGSFVVLCLLRVPIVFALFISSVLTIMAEGDVPLIIVAQRIWVGLNNFPLLAVPFFLFVGQLMNEAGISKRLIDFSQSMVGHLRGGLAHVNVIVSMIFAGISGASSADTSGVGSVMIPAMVKAGYPKGFTVGVTAASSTLGNIIPPSIMMIIYAATAGLSVGCLFLAGIVPGVMVGVGQIAFSLYFASRHRIGVEQKFSFKKLVTSTKSAVFALVMPVIVMGGIIAGVFTATEASVIVVVYALVLSILYRGLTPRKLYKVTEKSVGLFSLSLFCVAAASLWGWILAYYNVPQTVVTRLDAVGLLNSSFSVFAFVVLIFLVVGTFMDAIPAIIILQPIIGELVSKVGINPYHMGIVVVLTLAIGLITPPYGLCLLIASDLAGVTVPKAMKSLIPFFILSLIVVLVAIFFPGIMLFIPRLVMPNFMN